MGFRFLGLLALLSPIAALFQSYNGPIDGNICTASIPTSTSVLTFQAPANAGPEGIGVHQLAFQAVGNAYTYSGSPITINGIAGTYDRQCCACDAIGQAIGGGFSECGLTWCGGEENQWQTVDFTGVVLQQNSTASIVFPNPVSIATNPAGDPVFSISYELVAVSASPTMSLSATPSLSVSVSASPTLSLSATPSSTVSASPTLSFSATPSLSVSASPTMSESPTAFFSVHPTMSESTTMTASESQRPLLTPSPTVTVSPSGICYSARLSQPYVLGNYYYIYPGFNVSQPYGSGFISMGNFVGCSLTGASCRCSYTQGSTVSGCGGRRNSYITYSYGAVTGYTFSNESPTCSYNFAGTIGFPTSSPTKSRSSSLSISRSPSMSGLLLSPSASSSQTISSSPSSSLSSSGTISTSVSSSVSRSPSTSVTGTYSPSRSRSVSVSTSLSATYSSSRSSSVSGSETVSATITASPSTTVTPSETSTPLVYCVPYPSSTPTAFETPSSTPLVMITPWPTNGSATPSTSPFFMMVPYPSVSPIPIVVNGTDTAADRTAIIVTSVAVGALGITSVVALFQYLKVRSPSQQIHEKSQELEIAEQQVPEIKVEPAETYICINTVDLEEITQILTTFKKRFHVITNQPI
jgi:hypothetical protein